jgi:hypothetical protein
MLSYGKNPHAINPIPDSAAADASAMCHHPPVSVTRPRKPTELLQEANRTITTISWGLTWLRLKSTLLAKERRMRQ